jgi:hypothetical protein
MRSCPWVDIPQRRSSFTTVTIGSRWRTMGVELGEVETYRAVADETHDGPRRMRDLRRDRGVHLGPRVENPVDLGFEEVGKFGP